MNSKSTKQSVKVAKVAKAETVKVESQVVENIVPEVVVPEVVVPQVSEEEVSTLSVKQRLELMIKNKQDATLKLKQEIVDLKKLIKDHELEVKQSSKKNKKKRLNEDGTPITRKPSGFASPVIVSDKLYEFLGQFGVKKDEPIARTDVTRHVTNYISKNNLQNPDYRREIIADQKLKEILGEPFELKDKLNKDSPKVYTYLQLQKYLSHHFPKKVVVPTVVV